MRPDPPANVNATDGAVVTTITWDAVVGASVYAIYRSPTQGDEGYIIGLTADLVWIDTTFEAAKVYWYSVRSRTAGACSIPSESDSGYAYPALESTPAAPEDMEAELFIDPEAPGAPTGLTAVVEP